MMSSMEFLVWHRIRIRHQSLHGEIQINLFVLAGFPGCLSMGGGGVSPHTTGHSPPPKKKSSLIFFIILLNKRWSQEPHTHIRNVLVHGKYFVLYRPKNLYKVLDRPITMSRFLNHISSLHCLRLWLAWPVNNWPQPLLQTHPGLVCHQIVSVQAGDFYLLDQCSCENGANHDVRKQLNPDTRLQWVCFVYLHQNVDHYYGKLECFY